jgi:hypothetical protein
MVTFGKHKGKTIIHVCQLDPSYALWAYNKGLIVLTPDELRIAKRNDYLLSLQNIRGKEW